MPKFYFTFGSGHHHGESQMPLGMHHVEIEAVDYYTAREQFCIVRKDKFAFQYDEKDFKSFRNFHTSKLPFDQLQPQFGPTK